jgi:hypothetical protein
MKLSLAVVTAMIGAATAFPADTSPVNNGVGFLMERDSAGVLTKRDCASGIWCNTDRLKLCKCNQAKSVSALSHCRVVLFAHTICVVYIHAT